MNIFKKIINMNTKKLIASILYLIIIFYNIYSGINSKNFYGPFFIILITTMLYSYFVPEVKSSLKFITSLLITIMIASLFTYQFSSFRFINFYFIQYFLTLAIGYIFISNNGIFKTAIFNVLLLGIEYISFIKLIKEPWIGLFIILNILFNLTFYYLFKFLRNKYKTKFEKIENNKIYRFITLKSGGQK